jgi:GNAT superfamily N-acetyltransferase
MTTPTFRDATSQDVDALSELLVELYAHELPDMLHGTHRAQAALTRRLLVAAPLGRRYVFEEDGAVIATGGIATIEEPRPQTPASAILTAPLHMDPVRAALTMAGAVRGVLTICGPPADDEVLLHSVVVAATHRGDGLGRLRVAHLEDEGRRRGKARGILQVISANTTARTFYRSLGYAEHDHPVGPVARRFGYPSVMMHKALVPIDRHHPSSGPDS